MVSKDGLELVVQTNYLGHFLLTNLLKAIRIYIIFLIILTFLKGQSGQTRSALKVVLLDRPRPWVRKLTITIIFSIFFLNCVTLKSL